MPNESDRLYYRIYRSFGGTLYKTGAKLGTAGFALLKNGKLAPHHFIRDRESAIAIMRLVLNVIVRSERMRGLYTTQYALVELGSGSTGKIIAVSDKDGNLVEIP